MLGLLVGSGCGDDGEGGGLDPAPVPGTTARFDLDADVTDPESFYDLPYPNDLRLDEDGRTDHSGFPVSPGNATIEPVLSLAQERRGSAVTPFAYFRFDAPLAERAADDWIKARPDAPVLLLGIEPRSRDYARLLPTVASTLPSDAYVPEHLLAVSTPPGVLLAPDSQYAFVVLRSLGDGSGQSLGVPESFALLRAGRVPRGALGEKAVAVYAPLWPALRDAGVDLARVAAASILSTTDVVAELAALTEDLRGRHPLTIENLHVDPDDGAAHERFCEVRAETRVPMFQRGTPPYDDDGRFEIGDDGLPVVQREEVVPLTITLPRAPMPEDGFPLVLYFHGTAGLSDQVVDRGPQSEPGGPNTAGRGPSHVLAEHGFATFGAALPLNPERFSGSPGISGRSYLNLSNLGAYPDTFRQMTVEQRLLLDALLSLEIDPPVVAACGLPEPALPGGYFFAAEPVLAMGQSLGGQITNMVGAVDPRVTGVVPTGSGGHWSLTVVTAEIAPGFESRPLIARILGVPELRDHLHPGLQLVQSVFEPAEPLVFAARLARDPLPGHPARSIYQPAGIDDPGFPNPIYAAMALASGNQQAGANLHPSLQRALTLDGLDGILDYDVTGNGRSVDDKVYTGVVVQYEDDGIVDSHRIFAQLDEVKYQYGCFFQSLLSGAPGTVPMPAPLGRSCPE